MNDYTLTGPKVNHKAAYRDAQEAAWRAQRGTDVARDAALRTLAAQATERYAGEKVRISKGLVIALNHGATLQADGTALVQSQSEPELVYTVNGHCDCPDATHGAVDGRCKHRWAKTFTVRALALATPVAVSGSGSLVSGFQPGTTHQEPGTPAAPVETITTLSEQLFGPQDAAATHTAGGQPAVAEETPMPPVTMDPDDEDDATFQEALDEYNQMAQAAPQRPASPAACPEAAFSLCLKGLLSGQDAQLTIRGATYQEFAANVAAVRGLLDEAPAARQTGSQADAPASAAQPPAEGWCGVHSVQMRWNPAKDGGGGWWSHKTAEGWCKGKGAKA